MKKSLLFSALSALLFIAGCSTTTVPFTPKPHPGKYALQVIRIEGPVDENSSPSIQNAFAADLYTGALISKSISSSKGLFATPLRGAPVSSETTESLPFTRLDSAEELLPKIEVLLNDPNATIIEFPIVYAGIGETAINDQTETISAPKSFEAKTNANGVVSVVYSNGTAKIGQYVKATLRKGEGNSVACDLVVYENSLAGMRKYQVAPATETQAEVTASQLIFKKNGIDTSVDLAPGTWIGMGGLISEQIDNADTKEKTINKTYRFLFLRILPPAGI